MSRLKSIRQTIFATLALGSVISAWWGCSAAPGDSSNETTTTSGTGGDATTSTSSSSGSGGVGGLEMDGGVPVDDAGACVSTSADAERVPLDIIFLVDRSGSMSGSKWVGTTTALTDFFEDPASVKIGVGLSLFPNFKADHCNPDDYKILDVPIAPLPGNAFALTNALPADATAWGTPTYAGLKGVLAAATAYQDAHPKHKVVVVLATDGDPTGCEGASILQIADLIKSARNYNGVTTYVIGVEGSIIPNLNILAAAGGTGSAYDVTNDINLFSAKMEEIRNKALGCEFEIPLPPDGEDLDPDKVNFSYTPAGMGDPKLLLRAKDLVDCAADPGWYYDSNSTPTKIILCPASCATVQLDLSAEVDVLFGCKSQIK